MAGEYGCASDTCQRQPNWLITHLNPPATLSVCDEDAPVFFIPLLAGELGVDPQRLYDVIKRFTDREAAREAKEADKATATAVDGAPAGPDEPPDEPPGLGHLKGTEDGSVSGEGITVQEITK